MRNGKTRARIGLMAGVTGAVVVAALAWPVVSQPAGDTAVPTGEAQAPKSLLPDVFGPSEAAPAPVAPAPAPDGTTPPAPEGAATAEVTPTLPVAPTAVPGAPDPFAIPAPVSITGTIGKLTPAVGGFGPQLFDGTRGRFLTTLGHRLSGPIASRWAAILLRRALLSDVATPWGVTPGDWVSARARAMLVTGEIDGAHLMVDAIPVDAYTPATYRTAAQVALAAADIGGLCPIASTGRLLEKQPLWDLAVGMCAAMSGDDITAARVFDELRSPDSRVDPFDVRLGERVATMAGGAGRATNVEWAEAPPLNLFRYGVATAAGIAVPADRLAPLGGAAPGWLVRSAGVPAETRLSLLRRAAALGTMSADEVVSAVAALTPADASGGFPADSRAGRLRTAFSGSIASRVAAMQALWDDTTDPAERYGALVETAPAAARLPVTASVAGASADIITSLVAAGRVREAARWWPVAETAGDAIRARAWAQLALAGAAVPVTPAEFRRWQGDAGANDRHAALLLAGLVGAGRAAGDDWDGLKADLLPGGATRWSRAIDAAAAGRRTGEVIVLAATGLQGGWRDIPALHMTHIMAALARVGLTREAGLIAAEAQVRA